MEISTIYKKTAIWTMIMAVLMVGGVCSYMVYVSPNILHRNSVVQVAPGEIEGGTGQADEVSVVGGTDTAQTVEAAVAEQTDKDKFILSFNNANSSSDYLWIPVADGTTASNVIIENHYMDRQLWVSVENSDIDFYRDNYISGNLNGVSYGEATTAENHVVLKFNLDHVYEFNTIFENGVLYIEKVSPHELYDKIVVIDPAGNIPGMETDVNSLSPARICLDIAAKVKTDLEGKGIQVYVTRLDERELPDEESISLSAEVKPDLLVRIETSFDEDSKVYGTQTVYNGTYFIPGFGSVELADLLEAHVTTSVGGLAGGLVDATDADEVIKKATVPAAAVKVGYFTNTQENILLNRDDYRTKIAQGITDAVLEAFDR